MSSNPPKPQAIRWPDAVEIVVVADPDDGDVTGRLAVYRPEIADHAVADTRAARSRLVERGAVAVRTDVRRVRTERVVDVKAVLPDPRAAVVAKLAERLSDADLVEAVVLVERYYG